MDLSIHGKAGWVYNYTSHWKPQNLPEDIWLMSITGYKCIQELAGNLKSTKTVFKHEDTFCKFILLIILNTWHQL